LQGAQLCRNSLLFCLIFFQRWKRLGAKNCREVRTHVGHAVIGHKRRDGKGDWGVAVEEIVRHDAIIHQQAQRVWIAIFFREAWRFIPQHLVERLLWP
jgi:hypothetical protein